VDPDCYIYHKWKRQRISITLKCVKKDKEQCTATGNLNIETNIITVKGVHNHEPDPTRVLVEEFDIAVRDGNRTKYRRTKYRRTKCRDLG
jgi:hypothetical protein